MPREQINYPRVKDQLVSHGIEGTPIPTSEPEAGHDAGFVHVGWNKAGWVQVSMWASAKYLQFAAGNLSDGNGVIYSEVLTRAEVNKMIQALRRARDAAYGADA